MKGILRSVIIRLSLIKGRGKVFDQGISDNKIGSGFSCNRDLPNLKVCRRGKREAGADKSEEVSQ